MMASYQKRGKTWQYTISRMINGQPDPIRKGGFRTKGEAQAAAGEIEQKMRKGIQPVLKNVPLDGYFEEWLRVYKPDIKGNTKARYLNTLKTLQEHFAGDPIQNITKRKYQSFLNEYGSTRSKETTRKLNTHIRACVKDAIDEGIIHIDFTRGAVLTGAVPAKREEEKHLSLFESKRLIERFKEPEFLSHYLILLGLTSGLRYAELVGLTRKDFLFKTNELNIDKTWGYTKKMHEGFGPTKNAQSVRKIKMDGKTMALFKELFAKHPDNIHGLVFYSPTSKYKVLCNTAVNKVLKKVLEKMNIQVISAHGLRHTHASILLYKRASIYYVSERLGHSDIETTNSYYAHIIKELREQDDKISIKTFEDLVG
jgi:integrase